METSETLPIICPSCQSINIKLNGHIHNKKQNHQCKDCSRQFVLFPCQKIISEETKSLIEKLLLEKISLAGISRSVDVSETWLQAFISELYLNIPENLGVDLPDKKELEAQLSLHNEKKLCEIALLKKTLQHLSQQLYGKILRHLK
jgi:transposase-like protein